MMRIRIALFARDDLDEIHDYIAQDKPAAAEQWLDHAWQKFALLASSSSIMGESRVDLRPGLRAVSLGNYVIYFRYLQDQRVLEIARVLHGARDISQITF